MTKTMMLYRAGDKLGKTFAMIPVTNEAPYIAARYDLTDKNMVVILKDTMQGFRMLPRLTDDGAEMESKKYPGRSKQERHKVDSNWDFLINERQDIIDLVNQVAVNADTFDLTPYLDFGVPTPDNGNQQGPVDEPKLEVVK